MRLKLLGAVIAVPAGLVSAWAFHQTAILPFGYVSMVHVEAAADFNAPPDTLARRYSMSFAARPSPWVDELRRLPLLDRIRKAVEITHGLQAKSSNKGRPRTSPEIYQSGAQYMRICSEDAKILTSLLQSAGTPARVIWMCGHTTAEVFDGSEWMIADADMNVMFRRGGDYLSVVEVLGLEGIEVERIVAQEAMSETFVAEPYLRNDCIVQIDPQNDFHLRLKDPANLAKALALGLPSIASGLQYVGGRRQKLGSVVSRMRLALRGSPLVGFPLLARSGG